ncbi:adhesive domain-containing protein [Vagococcus sp.]|uniref:adhesive domain-containing protein n=1 Tax=Vagococcus sp. TaxID=1933889 RepID=UPI003F9E4782
MDIEIFSGMTTKNTSYTTSDRGLPMTSTEIPVDFIIQGAELANVTVQDGTERYAMLVVPEALRGKVQPNGQAVIETSAVVNLKKVKLLTGLFDVVNDLLSLVDKILNGVLSLVGISINLDDVLQQLELLEALENLPSTKYEQEIIVEEGGQILTVAIDKGLGPILAEGLIEVVENLAKAVEELRVEIKIPVVGDLAAGAINGLLLPIKKTLASVVSGLVPVLKGGGAVLNQLTDASVLGETTITIPTLVSAPEVDTNRYAADFITTVVRTNQIELHVLNQSENRNTIYFTKEQLLLDLTQVPKVLNFGIHPIRQFEAETFSATIDGESDSPLTTGYLTIEDSRRYQKEWTLKVKQESGWLNENDFELNQAQLNIHQGALTSSFDSALETGFKQGILSLSKGDQKELLRLYPTTETGVVTLELPQFDLELSDTTYRMGGKYRASFVWAVSDEP